MITLQTIVDVKGVKPKDFYEFILNCTDEDYNRWWPGTHLVWHTVKKFPGNTGNLIYSEQMFGGHLEKGHSVIKKLVPYNEMHFQVIRGIRVPVWYTLKFDDIPGGVRVTHLVFGGFNGIGKIFDPLFRLYLSEAYNAELDPHVIEEFHRLATVLAK
ncbi:hypothetical protein [Leptospira bouyouniensis]|uniref:SRPBCC family protein n=1 Tax=Leptospira bouyouniensis TaxID=2484911 RepID=A0ABY2L3H9_9LEPT|nr:hypothetical protein [Leptospira bouyouniensis]TGK46668.1 hypothetical protein EHQ10_14995 [Leptospira bouyouniensis]